MRMSLPHLVPVTEAGGGGGVGAGGAGHHGVHIIHHAVNHMLRVDHPVNVLKHLDSVGNTSHLLLFM